MVRIMKSITLDTTHNFTQFVRYTLSWRKRQSENEALPVTILVTRQRTLDDTIDAIKIYGHFISIYSIKLFIYFILLHLYVIRNKFARVNFYVSFFLFSRWRGREREEYKIWTRIWERRDKLKNKNRDWHQSTEQPDYIVSNVEIIESYYYFQGLCHAFISFLPSEGRSELARDQQLSRTPFVPPLFIRFFFPETHPSNFTASTCLGQPLCIKPFEPDNP